MRFVIVTGMSGAGKTSVMKILEDMGFYCVDNLPIPLLPKFAELVNTEGSEVQKAAIGIDIRNEYGLGELEQHLKKMEEQGLPVEIVFMEASDATLIRRYKETRRSHPMTGASRIEAGIAQEREQLAFLKKRADYIIDTSKLLIRDLIQNLDQIFRQNSEFKNMVVTVLSFGFKNGIPADADLVFDVRFLPNPYYEENLKLLTGNDTAVQDFVMAAPQAGEFLNKLVDMIQFLIPNYVIEGKNQLVIAVGCTGGKHRSVTIANRLYKQLSQEKEYRIKIEHRDILK
ncbi:MAG: RNase adapter RapZ [Eubacteriales bacterium]|nr:RNase adapter RapZ [Eubacteriales bacterium]